VTDPALAEPLAGVVRRLLVQAGYEPFDSAGFGPPRTPVKSGFQIAAMIHSPSPEPDPSTIVVWYRPRYDELPGRKYQTARHAEYVAVLNAAGLDTAVSEDGGTLIVRRRL